MSKPKTKPSRKAVPKDKRAKAAAAVLVDGKSLRQAAEVAGTSASTVRRAIEEVKSDEDLAQYVTDYRAKALPQWLDVVTQATQQTLKALPDADARDASAVAKTFSEMVQRAAGEADVKHEHLGDLAGARESLAARVAALSDSGAKGSGS